MYRGASGERVEQKSDERKRDERRAAGKIRNQGLQRHQQHGGRCRRNSETPRQHRAVQRNDACIGTHHQEDRVGGEDERVKRGADPGSQASNGCTCAGHRERVPAR